MIKTAFVNYGSFESLILTDPCLFEAISSSDCPCQEDYDYHDFADYRDYYDYSECIITCNNIYHTTCIRTCNHDMNHNDLCEADAPLPDGNTDFEINNCPGTYDVFKCVKGK